MVHTVRLRPASTARMSLAPDIPLPLDGACTCREVRFRLSAAPMFVHCCHCTWCQRETGTAFALNALIESDRVSVLSGSVDVVLTPTASGKGQKIARCPQCRVALWSNYAGSGDAIRFVRVGTLEQARHIAPDVYIYTSTRQPW